MKRGSYLLILLFLSITVYSQEPAKIKPAQSMNTPRAYHEGIYIPIEGAYLVCGGKNGNTTLDTCEFFSIQTLSWSNGPKMKVARNHPPIANLFALSKQGSEKGSILIVGGEDSSGNPLTKVDFYDIQTKSIDEFKPLPIGHSGGVVFFNPTEEPLIFAVLIGPGSSITKLVVANQDINWVQSPNSLKYPRVGHRFVAVPENKILIIGGGSKTLELYNYIDDTVITSKDLPTDIKGHQIISLSNSNVLIVGGTDENGNFIEDSFIYNPLNDELKPSGKLNIPRKDFRLTLLHNGKVLVSGGIDKNGKAISQMELYDPIKEEWTVTLNLNIPRANHTAELIGPEGVLICGGNTGENSASIKTCEIYSPEKICTPGSFSCDGKWIVKCNSFGDGTNKTNECPDGCVDGQCVGRCKEGERRCRDIGVKIIVEICNATGGWVLFQQCEESCKNGYCDGEIPPQDTGVVDSGKDIGIDNFVADKESETTDEKIQDLQDTPTVEEDIVTYNDTLTPNKKSDSNESSGCNCSLVQ
ncbi:MAG: hypothetical protein QXP04_05305 [Candidatus Nanoarchaeia archaeon]|nr:hypothetical protein [Candidatus Jingweiarchaeum tengchongense]